MSKFSKYALTLVPLLLSSSLFAEPSAESKSHAEIIDNTKATLEKPKELCDTEEANTTAEEELFEKKGFLTSEDCAVKGTLTSCYSESYVCNYENCWKDNEPGVMKPTQLVLFVHDDSKYYKIELTDKVKRYFLDEGIGRNEITIIGKYNESENVIYATEFKTPPPPSKSFFKGCL